MNTPCCDAFKRSAGELNAPVGGGGLYPPEARPLAQFEPAPDGETWSINGCCGGGCFVVVDMRYCPYCGTRLSVNK